jgi:hypothetical protein
MNPEAQEILNKILLKSPSDLSTDEILFLRARKSYLKPVQVEEYKEVLEEKKVEVKKTLGTDKIQEPKSPKKK